jgi:hypothetical protein
MPGFWERDDRINDETVRQLEKKVHWLMAALLNAGVVTDPTGGGLTPTDDITADADEVGLHAPKS